MKAANALNEIMHQIEAWYDADKRKARADLPYDENGWFAPTPPERAFGEQYGVDWRWGIDWTYGIWAKEDSSDQVSQIETLTFVETGLVDTWQGPQPFDAIMEKLGGAVYVTALECRSCADYGLLLTITCSAFDEAKAEWIERTILDQLAAGSIRNLQKGIVLEDSVHLNLDISQNLPRPNGTKIVLDGMYFVVNLPENIAIINEFLRSHGCVDIQYSFTQLELKNPGKE
jgi:hypothetical protein